MRINGVFSADDVDPAQHSEIKEIENLLGKVGGPFAVLLHSPGLAEKIMRAGAHVRLESTLTPKDRQLAIAVLACEIDCEFEWMAHYQNALDAGISESTLNELREVEIPSDLDFHDSQIVEFVQCLMRTHRVPQRVFDYFLETCGERWLVELTGTVGQYLYIGAILNVFEVDPPKHD